MGTPCSRGRLGRTAAVRRPPSPPCARQFRARVRLRLRPALLRAADAAGTRAVRALGGSPTAQPPRPPAQRRRSARARARPVRRPRHRGGTAAGVVHGLACEDAPTPLKDDLADAARGGYALRRAEEDAGCGPARDAALRDWLVAAEARDAGLLHWEAMQAAAWAMEGGEPPAPAGHPERGAALAQVAEAAGAADALRAARCGRRRAERQLRRGRDQLDLHALLGHRPKREHKLGGGEPPAATTTRSGDTGLRISSQ